MPWYKAGTVSVTQNSSTVLGTGTAFIANGRVGDGFRGPDGGWYEVTNFASDTALSISPPYQGTTNSAGSYALAPLQGYVKDSADALRALVNQYGAKLAALGTTGNYDTLPVSKGGTGGTTQVDARSGLGLGSVATENTVPVAKGGTGGTTQVEARSGLGLGSVATENTVPVAKGGTGGTTQAAARTGLGLGTAAVAAVGTAPGNVMPVGAGGWLGASIIDGNANAAKSTGFYSLNGSASVPYAAMQILHSEWGNDSRWQSQLALGISQNRAYFRSILKDQTSATAWAEFYHTGNTTRAADGTLKAI